VTLSTTESFDICDGAKLLSLEEASAVYMGLTTAATNMGDAQYFVVDHNALIANVAKTYCNEEYQSYSESPGVWYKVIGSNVTISMDSCSNPTGFQPVISVFEGSCQKNNLTCASASYTYCSDSQVGIKVNWYAEANITYHIFVFGNEKTDQGDFTLNVTVT